MRATHPQNHVGFLVWNPAGRLPTRVHDTLESAAREAERLHKANPGQLFLVMSPVLSAQDARTAKAWATGKADGLAQAHRDIMHAEARTDRTLDQLSALQRAMKPAEQIIARARRYQSIVADCLCWFAGYEAAQAHRDSWERPWTPEREVLRELNAHLQSALGDDRSPAHSLDEEIPF